MTFKLSISLHHIEYPKKLIRLYTILFYNFIQQKLVLLLILPILFLAKYNLKSFFPNTNQKKTIGCQIFSSNTGLLLISKATIRVMILLLQ